MHGYAIPEVLQYLKNPSIIPSNCHSPTPGLVLAMAWMWAWLATFAECRINSISASDFLKRNSLIFEEGSTILTGPVPNFCFARLIVFISFSINSSTSESTPILTNTLEQFSSIFDNLTDNSPCGYAKSIGQFSIAPSTPGRRPSHISFKTSDGCTKSAVTHLPSSL